MELDVIRSLAQPADSRIVLLVMDGLGGIPNKTGRTELEAAATPNLDRIAAESVCGLHVPIGAGISPGSGPAHLALFGYDPIRYHVGRGVLSALGIDFDLQPGDIAARGNFCTIDAEGRVTDRRAGRIATDRSAELCRLLSEIDVPGVRIFVEPEKEHRFLLVVRPEEEGYSDDVADTDPQKTGVPPLDPEPRRREAEKTARRALAPFLDETRRRLAGREPANMVLLRGFSCKPDWPLFPEVFGLRAAAIAAYPMYRGVARLVGMEALPAGDTLDTELDALARHWKENDFFYVHVKKIDSAGEDGDFDRKVALIEEVDAVVPRIFDLEPDVLIVTGDHSTPAVMRSHSWHPVPVILWSRKCRPDAVERFNERDCTAGGLGPVFPTVGLMPLALANAGRLAKFGA